MKWIRLISLVTVCWACLWAASMAAPNTKEPQWQQWHEQLEAQKKAADELKGDNKELLDRLKAQETALLETQRKGVDWWLSAIGVGLTILGLVIAVGGILLPLYWQRSERRRLAQAQAEFARMNAEATGLLSRLQSYEAAGAKAAGDASKHAEDSKKHAQDIASMREKAQSYEPLPKKLSNVLPEIKDQTQAAINKDAAEAAQQLAGQADASDTDKLRARAIAAARAENPNDQQALEIYELWHALTVLNPDDSNAQFNSGYWAQDLYERGVAPGRKYWLDVLGKHYGRRLCLNEDDHIAAFNWGIAQAEEAQALGKEQDLVAARALWQAAGEKYAQALKSHPHKHKAACSWGTALSDEAQVVQEKDPVAAQELRRLAVEKFALALKINPNTHEAANNWGSTVAEQAQAIQEEDPAAAQELWKLAGEKFAQALKINPNMHEAADNWGLALGEEARAVREKDPAAAQGFWKLADEKFALALKIKPDMHETVNNRVTAWLVQFHSFRAAKDSAEATEMLRSAIRLLESHGKQHPESIPDLAYNLACAFALAGRNADALSQLEISSRSGLLPSHWKEDEDFTGLRSTVEYADWVATQHASDHHQ